LNREDEDAAEPLFVELARLPTVRRRSFIIARKKALPPTSLLPNIARSLRSICQSLRCVAVLLISSLIAQSDFHKVCKKRVDFQSSRDTGGGGHSQRTIVCRPSWYVRWPRTNRAAADF
jgi:hypothetical protein